MRCTFSYIFSSAVFCGIAAILCLCIFCIFVFLWWHAVLSWLEGRELVVDYRVPVSVPYSAFLVLPPEQCMWYHCSIRLTLTMVRTASGWFLLSAASSAKAIEWSILWAVHCEWTGHTVIHFRWNGPGNCKATDIPIVLTVSTAKTHFRAGCLDAQQEPLWMYTTMYVRGISKKVGDQMYVVKRKSRHLWSWCWYSGKYVIN